nr:rhomboid-like protein 14, mitochondrial [Ipomoea batatas]
MDRGRGRGVSVSRGMLPLLALHAVAEYSRLDRKPPVTAGLVAANTIIYLRPNFLDHIIPYIDEVWFNPHLVLKYKDLKRFFLSAFYHINESHLVYNMLSLLWKGIQLERSMGSAKFASMVAALVPMSQGITLLLAKFLVLFFDYDSPYYKEYAVGFSGVLFAMKVVLNAQSGDYTYVHGLMVPARYAAWAELILIQMFVPSVSFLGHLGGILAGLVYLHLKGSYSGSNPLIKIVRSFVSAVSLPLKFLWGSGWVQRRVYGQGAVGGRSHRNTSDVWRCQACTYDNPGILNICEMCGTDRFEYSSLHSPSSENQDIPLEELRRRRVERFGGL